MIDRCHVIEAAIWKNTPLSVLSSWLEPQFGNLSTWLRHVLPPPPSPPCHHLCLVLRCSRTYLIDSIDTMVVSNDFYWFTKLCTVLRPSCWLPRDSFLMKGGCFPIKEYNNGWTAWKVETIKEVVGFYFPSSCLHRTHRLSVKSLLLVYHNLFWCFSGICFRARLS